MVLIPFLLLYFLTLATEGIKAPETNYLTVASLVKFLSLFSPLRLGMTLSRIFGTTLRTLYSKFHG
ncbi:hypothetical protein DVH24_029931 [Malus domestica]|uniref:Uncharacterized protein n=1 Tax=Malus domestica TaxID=3750 RepID=A0A498HWM7_MALDO|nr:hypothetical protein DVH24_029931 [Malus domestica]